jgi:hypothetical protein
MVGYWDLRIESLNDGVFALHWLDWLESYSPGVGAVSLG